MKLQAGTFFVLSVLLFSTAAWAGVTTSEVAKLYVATFNRAPDAEGLDYWVNKSFEGEERTIDKIAMSFFDQPETRALYPEGNTDKEFVTSIYQNLFNRAPDAEGLAYWTGEYGLGGGMARSVMIEALKNGATGSDAQILANKGEVALYYAVELGLEDTGFSLANVTEDNSTVTVAKQAINANAGRTPVGLEDDIENYMAMISSAGELSPMMDEIGILLGEILAGDPSVVTITPPLENPDLANLPPAINIIADFGTGYRPEGSAGVYTGRAVIDITNLAFSESGFNASAALTATDVRRDGKLLLAGAMTLDINVGMAENNMTINIPITFSNLQSLDSQVSGGVTLSIPSISNDGQLLAPAVITFHQLNSQDAFLTGTVTMTQIADGFQTQFTLNTHEGAFSGLVNMAENQQGQFIVSTPGTMTAGAYTVGFNQMVIDVDTCSELPVSGNMVISGAGETKTLFFNSNCTYTIN